MELFQKADSAFSSPIPTKKSIIQSPAPTRMRALMTPPPLMASTPRHAFLAIRESPRTPPAMPKRRRPHPSSARRLMLNSSGNDEDTEEDEEFWSKATLPARPRPPISISQTSKKCKLNGDDDQTEMNRALLVSFGSGEDDHIPFPDSNASDDEEDPFLFGLNRESIGSLWEPEDYFDGPLEPPLELTDTKHEIEKENIQLVEDDSEACNNTPISATPMEIDASWST